MQKPENASKNAATANIPEPFASYLTNLEQHVKNNTSFQNNLFILLNSQNNPLSFALDLFSFASLKFLKKGKLAKLPILILESLKEWCLQTDVSHLLTRKLKVEALERALQTPTNNGIRLICEIYHLEDEKEYVKHKISHLLSNKKFKDGFHLITVLNLENEFALESCVFPLFFLGQEIMIKAYLSKSPHLQSQFIRILDSLCQDSYALREFVQSLNIESVKPKNMVIDIRWVQKRLPIYIDYFNIDIRDCPVLYHTRVGGAMSYLFRKRFVEESIEYEPWEEMILDTVSEHIDIQRALLVRLISINENFTAFRFAELLNLNKNDWPDVMLNIPTHRRTSGAPRHNPIGYENYLPLRLDRSDIYLVDTPEKLFEAVDDISENYNIVGLDAEWKPNLGIFKERAALCQLAVWDSVYLFDILALQKYQSKQIWEYMLRKIFYNKEIQKLGYGAENDLKVLLKTIDCEKEDGQNFQNLVDLGTVYKKLETHYPEIIEEIKHWHPPNNDDQKGLSQLCSIVLGRSLNKGEQFSNWERRPLREKQVFYAALDAYCLLMIYEKLYPLLKKMELDLVKVVETKQTPFKAEKPKVMAQRKPLSIKDFKVVVDNTVGGVTKYLRLLGADVVNLEEKDDHMRAVQIAQSQRRIIITSGGPYKKLSGYVPEDMCYCVDSSLNSKMQAVKILEHYKVQCQDSDIFSRCTVCNENQYIKVLNEELFPLWSKLVGFEAEKTRVGRKNNTVFKCDVTALDGRVHKDLPIQLAAFSPQVFEHIQHFFVCTGCGKVYWEGSHLSRLKKSISKYIDVKKENRTVYKVLLDELGSDNEESSSPKKLSLGAPYSTNEA